MKQTVDLNYGALTTWLNDSQNNKITEILKMLFTALLQTNGI